jgi:hypothetical protein
MDKELGNAGIRQDKINLAVNTELNEWAEKLGVTKVKLKAAINAAGPLVTDIENYLRRRK